MHMRTTLHIDDSLLNNAAKLTGVKEKTYYFLKTIIPSRKATRDYLGTGENDEEA